MMKLSIFVLIPRKYSHSNKMWPTSSNVIVRVQEGRRHPPSVLLVQWLQSASVRYLPDSIRACTVALLTSYGLDPAVSQSGWGEERDMNCGLKNVSEVFGLLD